MIFTMSFVYVRCVRGKDVYCCTRCSLERSERAYRIEGISADPSRRYMDLMIPVAAYTVM